MKKKKRCVNCKYFRDMYFEDGTPAGAGRCVNPKNKKLKHISAGTYSHNICDDYISREESTDEQEE